MPDGLRIKVTNVSKLEWVRNDWALGVGRQFATDGGDQTGGWFENVSQTPSGTLAANSGSIVAAAKQEWLSSIAGEELFMRLGYASTDNFFGVLLQLRFHAFTLGHNSEWSVHSQAAGWQARGPDSSVYTWYFPAADIKIVATPTLENNAASVDVLITNEKYEHAVIQQPPVPRRSLRADL